MFAESRGCCGMQLRAKRFRLRNCYHFPQGKLHVGKINAMFRAFSALLPNESPALAVGDLVAATVRARSRRGRSVSKQLCKTPPFLAALQPAFHSLLLRDLGASCAACATEPERAARARSAQCPPKDRATCRSTLATASRPCATSAA